MLKTEKIAAGTNCNNDESLLREASTDLHEKCGSIELIEVQIQNGTATQILQQRTTEVQILRQAYTKRLYIHITGEVSNAGRKRSIFDKKFAIRAPPKILGSQMNKGRATIRLQNNKNLTIFSKASIDSPVIILSSCPVGKLKKFMQVLKQGIEVGCFRSLVYVFYHIFRGNLPQARVEIEYAILYRSF